MNKQTQSYKHLRHIASTHFDDKINKSKWFYMWIILQKSLQPMDIQN